MDRRQLIYFRAVAACEHMGRAAEQLGITESGLSRSIARLESEYGTELFDRVGRRVRLNAYGRILLDAVEQAFAKLESGERTIRALVTSGMRRVNVGFVMSLGPFIVPDIISRFRAAYPDVHCALKEDAATILREDLLEGRIDLCLEPRRFNDAAITWEPLWEEEIVALVPPAHRLANATEPVDFDELAREDLIIFRESNTTRRALEDFSRRTGHTPNVLLESNSTMTVIGLVREGYAVAFMPEGMARDRGAAVTVRIRPAPTRTLGISSNRDRWNNSAVIAFRTLLTSSVTGTVLHSRRR